jgi:hypothetical protein
MNIEATFATPSTCTAGGMDAVVDIMLDNGTQYSGEVTLVRDHTGRWNSWGSPDQWAGQEVLNAADASGDRAATLQLVSDVASAACD